MTSSSRPSSLLRAFTGFIVIIGTIFLFVCWLRGPEGTFHAGKAHRLRRPRPGTGTFVDVVWLFLFLAVYTLGPGVVIRLRSGRRGALAPRVTRSG